MRHFACSLLAAGLLLAPLPLLAATPGAVQAAQSPTMPAAMPANGAGNFLGKGGGGKLGGFFTPEQRAMFMLQARDQLKDMAPDQRKAYRKAQVQKFLAMSDSDKQKMKADLQARWDALPQGQKDRMQQRLASREGKPRVQ